MEEKTIEITALMVQTKQYNLEPETQQSLLQIFTPFFQKAEEWKQKAGSIIVTDASQTREMKMAREARLALKDVRVEVEHERKRLKEDSLRKGKAVDGMANIIKFLIEPIEEHLEKQEKFVEVQEENKKLVRLDERMKKMQPYNVDLSLYNLKDMSEDEFNNLYEGTKLAIEQRIAKEKAEKAEQERIRVENEKLKKEAEERERLMAEERKKAESEKKAIEEKNRKEREAQELKLKKEREERERLQAEIKAKQDADNKAKLQAEKEEKDRIKKQQDAEKKAKLAPDKEKLFAYHDALDSVVKPQMMAPEGKKVLAGFLALFTEALNYLDENSREL